MGIDVHMKWENMTEAEKNQHEGSTGYLREGYGRATFTEKSLIISMAYEEYVLGRFLPEAWEHGQPIPEDYIHVETTPEGFEVYAHKDDPEGLKEADFYTDSWYHWLPYNVKMLRERLAEVFTFIETYKKDWAQDHFKKELEDFMALAEEKQDPDGNIYIHVSY